MCITKACEEPTSAGVWWRDDAGWKQYNATQAAAILQGVKDGATRLELGNLVSPKSAGGASYVVDLTTMKQINLASGYTRDVNVVHAPATAVTDVMMETVNKELQAIQKSILSLKKVVEDLLSVKDQATRKEQVEFQQTWPKQTNEGAELALGGPQAVGVDRESNSSYGMSYSDDTTSEDDYCYRDYTSSYYGY